MPARGRVSAKQVGWQSWPSRGCAFWWKVDAQFSPFPLKLLVCGTPPRHGSKDPPPEAWSWREHFLPQEEGSMVVSPRVAQLALAGGLSRTDVGQHGLSQLRVIRAFEAQPGGGQSPTPAISHPERHNQPLCPNVLWLPTRQRPWNPRWVLPWLWGYTGWQQVLRAPSWPAGRFSERPAEGASSRRRGWAWCGLAGLPGACARP